MKYYICGAPPGSCGFGRRKRVLTDTPKCQCGSEMRLAKNQSPDKFHQNHPDDVQRLGGPKEPVPAEAGEVFQQTHLSDYTPLPELPEPQTVQPKCDANGGASRWVCLTHGMIFRHQLDKDLHVSNHRRGQGCRLGWFCAVHNAVEVP